MKKFITRLEMVYAALTSKKSVLFVNKGNCIVRYTNGMTDEDIEEVVDADFCA